MTATMRNSMIMFCLLAIATPAAAQWTRVLEVPASNVFSLRVNGDTITAGTDTSVYISTNAGVTWTHSTKPVAGVTSIQATRVRNGRLYAGTFGQGVFISDDLGATWQAFNQGLVGGFLNSQLALSDLELRGDDLYAATEGAGVYVRNLAAAGTWSHFGEEFEPNQASNVETVTLGGTRLLASAGDNGNVFFRDLGDAEWTVSNLFNTSIHPGQHARTAAWTGTGWVVGTNIGVFRSVLGEEPWTPSGPFTGILNTSFATDGPRLYAAFDIVNDAVIETSEDDGAHWQFLDELPFAFVFKLARVGTDLYAGRTDGLWRRSISTVSVPGPEGPAGLRFALVGPHPVGDQARFRFELSEPGTATLEVFDAAGRRAVERVQQAWSAGAHEVALDVRGLAPGVYEARLGAAGRQAVVRMVHVR